MHHNNSVFISEIRFPISKSMIKKRAVITALPKNIFETLTYFFLE